MRKRSPSPRRDSRVSTVKDGLVRSSSAGDAPARNTPVRAPARPEPHSRSRDGRRGPGRRSRRIRRSRSLVTRPLAPLHLESADANRVTFLRAERTQLALDPRAYELALEVGRRVRGLPVDTRREAHHAVALDPERLSLALHVPVAPASGEGDAALARRRCRQGLTRRAAIEDLAKQVAGAVSRRGRYGHARHPPFGERARDARGRLTRVRKVELVQRDELRSLLQPVPVAPQLGVDRRDVLERIGAGRVNDMHEKPRALDVPKELLAEAEAA